MNTLPVEIVCKILSYCETKDYLSFIETGMPGIIDNTQYQQKKSTYLFIRLTAKKLKLIETILAMLKDGPDIAAGTEREGVDWVRLLTETILDYSDLLPINGKITSESATQRAYELIKCMTPEEFQKIRLALAMN